MPLGGSDDEGGSPGAARFVSVVLGDRRLSSALVLVNKITIHDAVQSQAKIRTHCDSLPGIRYQINYLIRENVPMFDTTRAEA